MPCITAESTSRECRLADKRLEPQCGQSRRLRPTPPRASSVMKLFLRRPRKEYLVTSELSITPPLVRRRRSLLRVDRYRCSAPVPFSALLPGDPTLAVPTLHPQRGVSARFPTTVRTLYTTWKTSRIAFPVSQPKCLLQVCCSCPPASATLRRQARRSITVSVRQPMRRTLGTASDTH